MPLNGHDLTTSAFPDRFCADDGTRFAPVNRSSEPVWRAIMSSSFVGMTHAETLLCGVEIRRSRFLRIYQNDRAAFSLPINCFYLSVYL